jgi:hypothetical protein
MLADLGEAVSSYHVNDLGNLVPIADGPARLDRLRKMADPAAEPGSLAAFLSWFFPIGVVPHSLYRSTHPIFS